MRLPINSSTKFELLGEADFRLVFFIASGLSDLKKAIAVNGHVAIGIGMKYRLSFRHQDPNLCALREPASRRPASSLGATWDRSFHGTHRILSCCSLHDDSNAANSRNRICVLTLPVKVGLGVFKSRHIASKMGKQAAGNLRVR